ncbi:ESPR-type extended signal peptide-containing protein [Burkholderia pseudomallei]|nr:ESPR-type extended signal peptide-containing protein [Burkholderia pseudomallei]
MNKNQYRLVFSRVRGMLVAAEGRPLMQRGKSARERHRAPLPIAH